MTPKRFEQQLRAFLDRDPFEPFVVELQDGRQFPIDRPAVAINNGGAGFLSDSEGLVDFTCRDVRRMHLLSGEDATR